MAARLGITQHAYSRIETGETKLDVARLQHIADVLEVAVEDLLNPEPLVLTIHQNNTGATNGYNRHMENHLSEEFLQRITDRYEAHAQEVQRMATRYETHLQELQRMNMRPLELLERKG